MLLFARHEQRILGGRNEVKSTNDHLLFRCNGKPIACTVTIQDAYTEHRVSWCLETSRTRILLRKVSIRDKGKSGTN